MLKERGWAIAGDCGLYINWHLTRGEAIAQHVSDLYSNREGFDDISPYWWNGKLDEQQARAWKLCQRKGDRAVKVTLTYLYLRSEDRDAI